MAGYVGFKKKQSRVGITLAIVAGFHLLLAGGLVWLSTTSLGQELMTYYKINIRNVKEPPKPKPPEPEPPKPEPPPPEPEAPPPPVEEAEAPPPAPVAPAPVELPSFGNPFASGPRGKFAGYVDLITSEIQRLYKQPPDLSQDIGLAAVFLIRVDDDGRLLRYELKRSSGNPRFDQSALQAISELKKLRPPPEGMSRNIVVKFIPPS